MSFLTAISSVLFRLLAYSFLRWIPGRQATYAAPLLFLLSLLSFQFGSGSRSGARVAVLEDKKREGESPDDEIGAIDLSTATAIDASDVVITTPTKHDPKDSTSTAAAVVISPPARPSFFSLLYSFLLGSPSASPRLNKISIALNTLLLFAVLDSLWTPILLRKNQDLAFHRVGSITHNAVKILARTPPRQTAVPVATGGAEEDIEEGGARIAYRLTRPIGGKWIVAQDTFNGTAVHDWTSMIKIDNLLASSEYEYRLLLPSSTAMTHHPSFPALRTFTTSPDPALFDPTLSSGGGDQATHYKFVTSSCLRANFPYAGPFAHDSLVGAQHLAREIERQDEGGKGVGIKFMLFLGDFIYSDVPHYSGANRESYWSKYRGIFASNDWSSIYERIPIMSILDDHEIYNDFSSSVNDVAFPPANTAFVDYLGAGNPSPSFPTVESVNYFDYRYGDSSFFVMDVRAYRSENSLEDGPEKTMLGLTQKSVLLDWLAATNGTVTWKFIVTSSPFMALWSHGEDTWAGFLHEREELLDILQYVPNVIILSGDRHEVASASFRNGTVTEISTSPLNQFYLPLRTLSQSNAAALGVDDVLLKYLPDGNTKFTTLEVDNRVRNRPTVRIRVVIDGEDAWSVEVQGKQLAIAPIPSTVGALGKSLLELLGFKRRTWF